MMKAIDTIYNGYMFRSRLEARWAVFFDELEIAYEYEKEGYRLTREPYSPIDYLPDFWLPERDCFIEIKGQVPTPQEKSKAAYLALNSRKNVYIFFGNIHVPSEDEISVYKFGFPTIWLEHPEHSRIAGKKNRLNLVALFGESALEPGDLDAIDEDIETRVFIQDHLSIDALDVISGTYQMGMSISRKADKLVLEGVSEKDRPLLTYHIEHHTGDLLQRLEGKEDWTVHVSQPYPYDAYMWLECDAGEGFWIGRKYGYDTCHCACNHGGNPDYDSPRLIAAYNAARQARFEHSEKGHRHVR